MLRMVKTENGMLQGVPCGNPRVTLFKGVPYAKPPTGELRWRAPQPADRWEGIRMADAFAPIAWQSLPGPDPDSFWSKELYPAADDLQVSEDCLYLNVWTPARTDAERLPVYLWIHGGALVGGYSYEMEFDGEQMARKGIVFVTIAYRLNAFGFLVHPDMEKEDPQCPANLGLRDCLFALKWIRRNIAAFGGDPDRITIGGQSSGAEIVLDLCASPMAENLIAGAITQSGGGLRGFGYNTHYTGLAPAQEQGKKFLQCLGVSTLEEARSLDAKTIFEVFQRAGRLCGRFGPVIDGIFLREDPTDQMMHNGHPRIPYLLGSNSGEGPGRSAASAPLPDSIEAFESFVRDQLGEDADGFLKLCNVQNAEQARDVMRGNVFNMRTLSACAYAELQAEQGRLDYIYFFNHDIPGDDNAGPYHGSEMWFTFDSLNRCWRPFAGKDYDLARQISSYWVNFVKTGDPNGSDSAGLPLPEWKPYSKEDPFVMEFRDTPSRSDCPLDELTRYKVDHHLGRLNR